MPSLTLQEIFNFSLFPTNVFVETGTLMGETIDNVIQQYKHIHSIELSKQYADNAKNKYKNYNHVTIHHGDSSIVLYELCKIIQEPTFFWLDGHWSGGNTAKGDKDCPLIEELNAINSNLKSQCIIAIDDVRLFNTYNNENWLGITHESILEIVKDRLVSYKFYPSAAYPEDRMVLTLKAI
jgi:hypothetical protein